MLWILHFQNGDPFWGIIFSDMHFDNFAVNEDGQVYVIDVESVAVIEKSEQGKKTEKTLLDVWLMGKTQSDVPGMCVIDMGRLSQVCVMAKTQGLVRCVWLM